MAKENFLNIFFPKGSETNIYCITFLLDNLCNVLSAISTVKNVEIKQR